jgi:hypothetical protein
MAVNVSLTGWPWFTAKEDSRYSFFKELRETTKNFSEDSQCPRRTRIRTLALRLHIRIQGSFKHVSFHFGNSWIQNMRWRSWKKWVYTEEACGNVVVKATPLQAGKSRIRDPKRWMIDINLPNPWKPWGLLSLQQKWVSETDIKIVSG